MIRRGEVWTANLNPSRGREIGKIRPVLIMQADELNDAGTPMVVVLPLTTHVYPEFRLWRITVSARDRLKDACQVVVDQPRALDRARIGDGPLTTLSVAELASVERSLRAVLGMTA
ncbi:MAG TPA: type II toxin-antitoxin system PemK/MazF family toxin [Steroidobacteraceae bacterium]|jgi:mRNA interferase MazF